MVIKNLGNKDCFIKQVLCSKLSHRNLCRWKKKMINVVIVSIILFWINALLRKYEQIFWDYWMSIAVTLNQFGLDRLVRNLVELSPFVCIVVFCFRSFRLQVEEEENKRRSELYISTLLEDINPEESWYKVRH